MNIGDILASTSMGLTDVLGVTHSKMPTVGRTLKQGEGDFMTYVNAFLDPTGVVEGGTKDLGHRLPKEVVPYAQVAAPMIGGFLYGPGGAAAGSRIGDLLAEGSRGEEPMSDNWSAVKAGGAAALTYVGGLGGEAAGGAGAGAEGAGTELAMPDIPTEGEFYGDVIGTASGIFAGGSKAQPQAQPPAPVRPPPPRPTAVEPEPEPVAKAMPSGLSGGMSPATGSNFLLKMLSNRGLQNKIGSY